MKERKGSKGFFVFMSWLVGAFDFYYNYNNYNDITYYCFNYIY